MRGSCRGRAAAAPDRLKKRFPRLRSSDTPRGDLAAVTAACFQKGKSSATLLSAGGFRTGAAAGVEGGHVGGGGCVVAARCLHGARPVPCHPPPTPRPPPPVCGTCLPSLGRSHCNPPVLSQAPVGIQTAAADTLKRAGCLEGSGGRSHLLEHQVCWGGVPACGLRPGRGSPHRMPMPSCNG